VPLERPVSRHRSSNRTCAFPASGFPTGFTAGSRDSARPAPVAHPRYTKLAADRFHSEGAAALRRRLVAPDEEVAYPAVQVGLCHRSVAW
jgi:hypothetical protein